MNHKRVVLSIRADGRESSISLPFDLTIKAKIGGLLLCHRIPERPPRGILVIKPRQAYPKSGPKLGFQSLEKSWSNSEEII